MTHQQQTRCRTYKQSGYNASEIAALLVLPIAVQVTIKQRGVAGTIERLRR